MRVPSLVVIGSSNTDLVINVPSIPRPGETVLGGEFSTSGGGKGANQAVAAARSGGHVTFVARLGADHLGDQVMASLRREKITTKWVVRDPRTPSGVALIVVSEQGENSIAVAGGANSRLSAADVRRAAPVIRSADAVLLQLETPLSTVLGAAKLARKAGVSVQLNPAPAQRLSDELLAHVSLLTPNQTEAAALTGIEVKKVRDAARAAAVLRTRGVETVIITLGREGVWLDSPQGGEHVPGFRVQAVDTTGAGDTFNGALAVRLAEGASLREAVRFGQAAAALSVTRSGAQPSMPTRREIDRFLTRQA